MNAETMLINFSTFLSLNLNLVKDCMKNNPESAENFYFQALGARVLVMTLIMETSERIKGVEKINKVWGAYLEEYDKIINRGNINI